MEAVLSVRGRKPGSNFRLRENGCVPCVIYGNGKENVFVSAEQKTIKKIISSPYFHIVFELLDEATKKSTKAVIKEIQREPISGDVLHVDFLVIDKDKSIKTKVPLFTKGESYGVKNENGVMQKLIHFLPIKVLPYNIPEKIEVDVTKLRRGQKVYIKDIPKDSFEFLLEPERVVITIIGSRTELEAETGKAVEEVAVPGETPAEGAAMPAAAEPSADAKAGKEVKPAKEKKAEAKEPKKPE